MNKIVLPSHEIKAVVGLGNPGQQYVYTRHNIGFRIVEALVDQHHGSWNTQGEMMYSTIEVDGKKIIVLKPLTFMNDSGRVFSFLYKKGIKQEHILVVHDEIELPFGEIKLKFDGSTKGHNGLKSIVALGGSNFYRLRFGVDRPAHPAQVPDYVLAKFKESEDKITSAILRRSVCKYFVNCSSGYVKVSGRCSWSCCIISNYCIDIGGVWL
jgi:PTH1 family peptidyl-tRNA hydrolase